MDQKILKAFKAENPDKSFPWYETLSPSNAELVRIRLLSKTRLSKETSPKDFINELYNNFFQWLPIEINANSENFSLEKIMSKLELFPLEDIYINWYRFDHIDKMRFKDVCVYFEDIFCYQFDDVDIFDDTLKWIFCIEHDGRVAWTKFM